MHSLLNWIVSLSPQWKLILLLLIIGEGLYCVGVFIRWSGARSIIRSVGLILAASAIPPLVVFSLSRSASRLWLLLAPFILLLLLLPLLNGLRPHTVHLSAIELHETKVSGSGNLRIAHLSDLHLCDDLTMEGKLKPDRVRDAAQKALGWALDRADHVLVTGDLTDRGSPEEWPSLAALLAEFGSKQATRVHLVPGNHDLCIALEYRPNNDGELLLAHEQQHRDFATSLLRSCPPGWRVGADHGDLSVSAVLSDAEKYIEAYKKDPPRLGFPDPLKALIHFRTPQLPRWPHRGAHLSPDASLEERFADIVPPVLIGQALKQAASAQAAGSLWPSLTQPLYIDLVRILYPIVFFEDQRFIIIGMNSNTALANSILSGAFGLLGADQLARLDVLLEASGDRCKLVALHHHVGWPNVPAVEGLLKRARLKTLQLCDAEALHRVLRRYKNVVMFHGHEHIGYRAAKDSVTIISAPSVAYGNRTCGPNCFVYDIAPEVAEADEKVRILESATFTAES